MGLVLTPLVIRLTGRRDGDGAREFHHTHAQPVSRLGGIVFAASFVVVLFVTFIWFPAEDAHSQLRVVVAGTSLAMFALGFWDDLKPLGARKKLIGQIVIAAIACHYGARIEESRNPFSQELFSLGLWSYVITIVWLVGMTNLINLIDGMDGLAGGIALMLMALLTYVGIHSALAMPLLVAATMSGVLLGFLRYNFPPARIYMGDGGAYFLGFLIGILSLMNSHKGTVMAALIAPLFALALPILDVSLAIVRRGLKGLPIFRPDRAHIHHKLIQRGFSRRRAVLLLYGISSVFLLTAFGVFWSEGRWVPILLGFVCLTFILVARSFDFSREWFAVGRTVERSLELRKKTEYALAAANWLELEGEQSRTLDDLWESYQFMIRKMGFSGVTLELMDGRREWKAPADSGVATELSSMQELGGARPMTVKLWSDSRQMSDELFRHLSELAAEAWLKATTRWQQANHSPARFNTRASDGNGDVAQSPDAAGARPIGSNVPEVG